MVSEQEHIRIAQDLYTAFGRGDIPGVLSRLSEDVEWDVTRPQETSYAGKRHGKSQVVEFFTVLGQTVEVQQFEPREFLSQGDTVAVVGHERLCIKATGRVAENDWVMIFTVRNGLVVKFREYDDTEAVAAAFRGA